MYKYPFLLTLALVLALSVFSFTQYKDIQRLELDKQKITEQNRVLNHQLTLKILDNSMLVDQIHEFSQTLTRYQELLREVGILVQRQCPEMFKHHKEHGPTLRRPQSLPDPEDLPKPTPKVDI